MGNGPFLQIDVSLTPPVSMFVSRIGATIFAAAGPFSHFTASSVSCARHFCPSAFILALGGHVHPGGMLRRGRADFLIRRASAAAQPRTIATTTKSHFTHEHANERMSPWQKNGGHPRGPSQPSPPPHLPP